MPAGRRRQAESSSSERRTTEYVVLERVRVVVVPEEQLGADHPVTLLAKEGEIVEGWIVRDSQEATKARGAIEGYVKPGTPEQRTGEFRAVPRSNWKGGERYVQPTLTPVKREPID